MNKDYLLVDLSFACFNKYYSTKKYYSLAKKEIDFSKYEHVKDIPGFIDQFKKGFIKDIENLKKKLKLNWENIYFAKDCPRKEIWRNEIYSEYKSTRDEMHKKQNFNGGDIFIYTYNVLLPELIKEHNCKLFAYANAEADDVIAITTKYILKNTNSNITIVANDNDYLQLLNDRVKFCNLKMKYKSIDNNKKELFTKILIGDVSDNIKPCYIKKHIVYKNNKDESFVKCSKKNILNIINNEEFLEKLFDTNSNFIKDEQHKKNRILIDFNCIPINIINNVESLIKKHIL